MSEVLEFDMQLDRQNFLAQQRRTQQCTIDSTTTFSTTISIHLQPYDLVRKKQVATGGDTWVPREVRG